MSTGDATLPAPRALPPWVESAVGQGLALLAAFAIAVGVGSLIIILYGENPIDVYSAMLSFAFKDVTSIGTVLSIATPLVFAALAVSVCFKGGLFNIGVEGQFLVGRVTVVGGARGICWLSGCCALQRGRSR